MSCEMSNFLTYKGEGGGVERRNVGPCGISVIEMPVQPTLGIMPIGHDNLISSSTTHARLGLRAADLSPTYKGQEPLTYNMYPMMSFFGSTFWSVRKL